jgi:nucleoprotein TPR
LLNHDFSQYKVESLSQQLLQSQLECERTVTELKTKSEEFANYRRTKHAELSQLQALHDSLTQTHAATESSFKALQSSHTAQTHQLTQALTRVQDLTGQLAEQEATYSSEASGLRGLVAMMEDREKQAKEIVDNIEKDWNDMGERAERREAALRDELDRERRTRDEADRRLEQLQTVMRRMERGELPSPGRGGFMTPSPSTDMMVDGMMDLSPTVAMVSKVQRSGKTFTEVYSELVRLQEEFDQKSVEYDQMEKTLASVLAQIQERVTANVFPLFRCAAHTWIPRRQFSRSNARSTHDCNQRLPNSLPSSRKLCPIATRKPSTLKRTNRS